MVKLINLLEGEFFIYKNRLFMVLNYGMDYNIAYVLDVEEGRSIPFSIGTLVTPIPYEKIQITVEEQENE